MEQTVPQTARQWIADYEQAIIWVDAQGDAVVTVVSALHAAGAMAEFSQMHDDGSVRRVLGVVSNGWVTL